MGPTTIMFVANISIYIYIYIYIHNCTNHIAATAMTITRRPVHFWDIPLGLRYTFHLLIDKLRNRQIWLNCDPTTLKFNRCVDSRTIEAPVRFQSDVIIPTYNFAASSCHNDLCVHSKFHEVCSAASKIPELNISLRKGLVSAGDKLSLDYLNQSLLKCQGGGGECTLIYVSHRSCKICYWAR